MVLNTPIGKLTLIASGGFLTHILFDGENSHAGDPNDPVLAQAARELGEYFDGKRHVFTVPINPTGGDFVKKIWNIMVERVGYGQTISYSALAQLAGSPRAARAVGKANNRNPIPIIIPCHRVVGKGGKLTGFRAGLSIKEQLLKLESNLATPNQTSRKTCP